MILLLDIGNTRLKWAELRDGVLAPQSAFAHGNGDRAQRLQDMLRTATKPDRVLISNVGGPEIAAACTDAIRARWSVEPEFVVSTAEAFGVVNAYREPEKLGVDRWLAVIATHAMQRGAACIVSVGTAMTIDGVDASGRHLGGVIVPGPHLMISSLLSNTSDIATRMSDEQTVHRVFANHTKAAVHQGCAQALAGLIDRALAEMEREVGARPRLLLTGGACDIVAPLIGTHERVEDLVLRGLAVLARGD